MRYAAAAVAAEFNVKKRAKNRAKKERAAFFQYRLGMSIKAEQENWLNKPVEDKTETTEGVQS